MKNLKIVFMGTTDFGVPALEKLVLSGYEVAAVVCQPDRPNKRGKKIEILPLKAKAVELGIPVLQPEKIKEQEFVEQLKTYQADVFIVAAYGQLLSKEILEMPPYGSLNIHGSLLPKYRGAAPIQRAIIDGEPKSGVTIMQMSEGMDTGDMIAKAECPITETTTYEALHEALSTAGAELLMITLEDLITGKAQPIPQNEEQASYADKIQKDTGHINWNETSSAILSLINGTDPHPGAYVFYKEEKIKCFSPKIMTWEGEETPGTVLMANDKEGMIVKTKDGALIIGDIQAPGKKRMKSTVFLRGKSMQIGTILK
ncbi:methionyl-tRNA formyltransferase [Acetobacterium paludosum]|uniref:Methionyl-tRNA formyltransferase n=1 Tax=Acetobacterium paludosum TaxID=52693 RepID=A0A923HUS8_9FIRM|nr:methionyl-tRNA formyltransferase [Acetobacterium paludosum]MBC3887635.1 methionyl-tRNA formyltransferase [Acetobacterium paludosum]